MAKAKKTDNSKCWWRGRTTGLIHCVWKHAAILENYWAFSHKTEHLPTFWAIICTLAIYQEIWMAYVHQKDRNMNVHWRFIHDKPNRKVIQVLINRCTDKQIESSHTMVQLSSKIENCWCVHQQRQISQTLPCAKKEKRPFKCNYLEEEMATHSSNLAWRIPMDRGVWQAAVHEVDCSPCSPKSRTRLSD